MNTIYFTNSHLWFDTPAMPERKETFAMIGPLRSIAASHAFTILFKDIHRGYAAGPRLILIIIYQV